MSRSGQGINNAYAQDNEIAWLDWLDIGSRGQDLREFTRKLIAVQKAYPVLSRGRFVVGTYNPKVDVKDVTWLDPTGNEMGQESMGRRQCQMLRHAARLARAGVRHHPARRRLDGPPRQQRTF
jgi:glycogen operon protein